MALSYKARRRWSLVILLVGLPAYIVVAWVVLSWLDRPSVLVELLVYIILGIAWALPFRFVFRGVGKAAPTEDAALTTPEDRRGAPSDRSEG
ncbi:DUF2842 domain-containing protein [Tropicimonas isoalkanivorans]|uniref:DUF2842 domain-containing protein n=1 Tax=Tropicimonas isoalkanivorans TaxID=441112 RepID=A0A1I1JQ82_9RHOB|nr:DUF2842 domain-containing protein [Tropicimonas isoalkanivorans]SFC48698.1 Protein of unknown function [Tropicimonas isoalkanivorans]